MCLTQVGIFEGCSIVTVMVTIFTRWEALQGQRRGILVSVSPGLSTVFHVIDTQHTFLGIGLIASLLSKPFLGTLFSQSSKAGMTNRLHLPDGRQWVPRCGGDVDSTSPGTEERSAARSLTGSECRLERRMAQMLQMPRPRLEGMQRSPMLPFCGYAASQVLCVKPLLTARWLTRKAQGLAPPTTCAAAGRVTPVPGNLKTRHPQCC